MSTKSQLIAVTGASGYIGGYVVKFLLEKGHRVRGIVRDLKKEDKYAFLKSFPQKEGQLELVEADIQGGVYDKILKGVDALIHTATPYLYTANDPQKEIIEPAIEGTTAAIKACITNNVKRIVITSSGGAVMHFPVEPGYVFKQTDWNTWSSLTNNPYFYSKRLAEEAAWKLYKENQDRIEVAVVNPLFVIGPPQSNILNTSLTTFKKYLLGEASIQPGQVGWVDVRDAAMAHVIAVEHPKAVGQRLFACGTVRSWNDLAVELKKQFPDYPVKVEPPQQSSSWSMDTQPLKELGMPEYRTFDTMVRDTVEAFLKLGVVDDLRKK